MTIVDRRAARRLELIDAGAFRLLLSSSYGAIGADLAGAMAAFETVATADASTGRTVMIAAGSWADRAGLRRATFDELYADGPDAIGPDQLGQRPDGADGIGMSARGRAHLTLDRWSCLPLGEANDDSPSLVNVHRLALYEKAADGASRKRASPGTTGDGPFCVALWMRPEVVWSPDTRRNRGWCDQPDRLDRARRRRLRRDGRGVRPHRLRPQTPRTRSTS